jgi:hypothetical protein
MAAYWTFETERCYPDILKPQKWKNLYIKAVLWIRYILVRIRIRTTGNPKQRSISQPKKEDPDQDKKIWIKVRKS